VADPLTSETYRPRDAASAAVAIHRLFAREPAILRKAAAVAAGRVRTDREHAIELIDYYQGLIDERAGISVARRA
jgi:alpha-1,6-mannosyltransferase